MPLYPAPVARSLTLPVGAIAATLDRVVTPIANGTPLSGALVVCGVTLPAGMVLTTLNMRTGSGAMTGVTHSWAGIWDANMLCKAISPDVIANIATATTGTFTIGPWTVPSSGLYYAGYCFVATGISMLQGSGFYVGSMLSISPILAGAIPGQSTPPAVGTTTPVATVFAGPPYIWFT